MRQDCAACFSGIFLDRARIRTTRVPAPASRFCGVTIFRQFPLAHTGSMQTSNTSRPAPLPSLGIRVEKRIDGHDTSARAVATVANSKLLTPIFRLSALQTKFPGPSTSHGQCLCCCTGTRHLFRVWMKVPRAMLLPNSKLHIIVFVFCVPKPSGSIRLPWASRFDVGSDITVC